MPAKTAKVNPKTPGTGQETQTITAADVGTLPPPTADPLTTPGDDADAKATASHPTKGRRYRVLGVGEGDYCIYQIAPQGSEFPAGCLIPIPEVPRFESTAEARRWAKGESKDLLAGKQIMVVQVMDIANAAVETRQVVTLTWKPKIQVSGPETEAGAK